jgi:hypothetical protein
MNSTIITLCVTFGWVFFDSLANYALSRRRFRSRGVIFASLIAAMAVPGAVLLIPRCLILEELGLFNSCASMILPLVLDTVEWFGEGTREACRRDLGVQLLMQAPTPCRSRRIRRRIRARVQPGKRVLEEAGRGVVGAAHGVIVEQQTADAAVLG